VFTLRFDMRAPAHGAPPGDLYGAALEMAQWADAHGCLSVIVSEHHGADDGYLPAPLILAAAMAARTQRVPIQVVALIASLHSPVEMAEQMAVLDLIAKGRVGFVLGLGYRQVEFDLYGIAKAERAARLEAAVTALRDAWSGRGVATPTGRMQVTPPPFSHGGPLLLLGGGSRPAVERAARLGLGMLTERSGDLRRHYREACAAAGTTPGLFFDSSEDAVTAAFVAQDPDAAWQQLGPYLLHDARMYAQWNDEAAKVSPASVSHAATIDELRAAGYPYRVFTPSEARDHIRSHGYLTLHPLCGGAPPEIGWSTLHLLADEVLPALSQ
jgi:alkanesulfonate monooxygenase SsuD/methylene tetrahydromethanopterin reductase-like flavin-dependent oxidoreductase (luciferase family)